MPSSRLDVATTQRSPPDLSRASTSARRSLDTEPWWASATGAKSSGSGCVWVSVEPMAEWNALSGPEGAAGARPWRWAWSSFSRAHRRSQRPRLLTKTMVEECASTRSRILASRCGHTEREPTRLSRGKGLEALMLLFFPAAMAAAMVRSVFQASAGGTAEPRSAARVERAATRTMSGTGTRTERSMSGAAPAPTTRTGRLPPRKRATRPGGRTVAERPTRWAGRSSRQSSRSRERARWAPRLESAREWTSSTITVSTRSSTRAALEVSMR